MGMECPKGLDRCLFLFFPQPGCPLLSGTASGKQAFAPYRSYPLRNPVQLPFRPVFQLNQCHASAGPPESFAEITEPYLVILNSLPKSALAPLFIVWLGTGTTTIIVAGMSVALFGSIISIYTGFQQVDAEKLILIQTLGGRKREPSSRLSYRQRSHPPKHRKSQYGLALVGVIIGEFLAARRGLGYLIIYGSQVFQLDMVITAILILCLIAFAFYKSIQVMEHRLKSRFL